MPRAVAHHVARSLKARIDAGEWPDARLPPERNLAADLGVARNTLRRAMTLLKQDGALAAEVGRGTFLLPRGANAPDLMARMAGASPADVMEIRIMLEPGAAAFAALNASASELAAIEDAHCRADAARHLPEFERWDAEFHHRIVTCSRNELLRAVHDLLKALRDQAPWQEMKRRSFTEERRRGYCDEHALVVSALQRRDPEAARDAMAAHLQTVRLNMLGR